MEVRHSRLAPGGFEQLRGRPDIAPTLPMPPNRPTTTSIYSTAVQQQDYLASVWLSKKEKLEHSQQKCIVIFALVCCFAVLLALIFSAVDVLGGDEDDINEANCNQSCKVVLVENIPEDISLRHEGTVPLADGLLGLLDLAQKSVEIVSPLWALNSTEHESHFPQAKQGRLLLRRLMELKTRRVQLKVASEVHDQDLLKGYGAEVHELNMTALTKGHLHSSFWVVDRKHMYIGSAGMDWRSLSTLKELGVIIYECRSLVLDLSRIFSLYWQLQYRDFVPQIWSKRLAALYNKERRLSFFLNDTQAKGYFSTSPDIFCPKDRTRHIEAIFHVIWEARKFIYISITDYLPLISNKALRYWSRIDDKLREAIILKQVSVRLLISCWEHTHPLTSNFAWSLKSLCMEMANCSVEVKFFGPQLRNDGTVQGVQHHRYMVTDNAVYIGNLDWVGNEFLNNAGVGLVIEQNSTLVERMKAVFNRDWHSLYSKTPQPNKISACSTHTVFPRLQVKGSSPLP